MPISINVTLRSNKSTPLTWAEGDANWSLLVANDQYLDSQLGNKQESNEKLAAIAASVWAANSILHLTGTNTLEVKPITAYGLQLIGYDSDTALKIALALNNVSNTADTDKPVSTATQIELDKKVDKVAGKVLSSNDFTDPEKTKLAGLENSHFRGVFISLSALTAGVASPLAGDYADVDAGTGTDSIRYIWDVTDTVWVSSGSGTSLTAAQVKTLYESNPDTNAFTDSEETKLGGIADGATANATNAQLRDRSTHTGTQLASTISDFAATVRGTLLAGLAAGTNAAIAATDSVLLAFAKLQTQLDNKLGLTAKAADSDKLNGQAASFYTATMTGATASVAGTKGLVPAPSVADRLNVLSGAGTWVSLPSTTSATWGNITGTLSAQTDLQTALNAIKVDRWRSANLSLPSTPTTYTHTLGVIADAVNVYVTLTAAAAGWPIGTIFRLVGVVDYGGSGGHYGVQVNNITSSSFQCLVGSAGITILGTTGSAIGLAISQCTIQVELLAWT